MLQDLAVLSDTSGSLTIDTVAASDRGTFKSLPTGSFAGGFTRGVHWFRFTVTRKGDSWLDIQPPVLDDLRLYEFDANANSWRERRTGDTLPFSTREVPYRSFLFKLHHLDDVPRTYYLRLQTTSTSALSPRLWTPDEFIAVASLESGLLMASIAIIIITLLYNVTAWFWLRDWLIPWFLAYLLFMVILFFSTAGFLQQYLFPNLPVASYFFVSCTSMLTIAAGNGFYRRFFSVERSSGFLYWLYETVTWMPLLALPIILLGYFTEIAPLFNASTALMTCIGVVLSLQQWRRGESGAGMMLIANMISMIGIMFFMLHVLGGISGGFALWNSLQIASLGTIIALQLAVTSRYRVLLDARIKIEQEVVHEREERIRQGHFLAMLAHELRTALSVLQMAVGVQPMSPKSVASAERAIVAMRDVIERSVQVEKITDGKLTIECQLCDIATLVEETIASSRNPVRVQFECATRPQIFTDAKLLRVILTNLIDNALKYGAVERPVEIKIAIEQQLVLRICNGLGSVGQPDVSKVFSKYYRAPAAGETIGSGLGLYISQALAKLLDGELHYLPVEDLICFELRL